MRSLGGVPKSGEYEIKLSDLACGLQPDEAAQLYEWVGSKSTWKKIKIMSHTLLFFLLMTSGFFYSRRYVLITYHLYARFLTYVWRYFVSDRRWFGCYFALDKHWWFPQGSFLNTVVKTPARTQLVSGRGLVDRFIDTSRNWDVCCGCVGAVSLGCRGLLPWGRIWGNNSSIHLTSRGLQCLHLSGRTTFAMIYVCPRHIYVLWLLWELRAVPVSRW